MKPTFSPHQISYKLLVRLFQKLPQLMLINQGSKGVGNNEKDDIREFKNLLRLRQQKHDFKIEPFAAKRFSQIFHRVYVEQYAQNILKLV